ncbi:hypothetical protein CKAN_00860100 [Cinnamomum micranthum f. kanehirae]|uniref:Uncharacterized protein n=1 Tax=Cinnamomum micranthum f. kanehirae TaxID=337451 RepID=A0A443NNF3_9MAGN|nr:hypothetical protein CKAN_00860100 [Cinnamomum micranthum f. kanehirae]
MKNLYRKKKSSRGKIHPSPSPSHTSTHSLSSLNLLPSAILTIVSVLSVDDQEVLAYLIHCSTTTTNPSTKKCNKPTFNCGCFDCYTRFWIRWDSSPNRHLIHQAIEAFEDHLSPSDHPSDKTHKSKPMNLRVSADKSVPDSVSGSLEPETSEPVPTATSTSTSDGAAADSARQCSNAEHEPTGNRLQPVASVQEQRGLVRKGFPRARARITRSRAEIRVGYHTVRRSGTFVPDLAEQTTSRSRETGFASGEDSRVVALCLEKEGDVAASCNRLQPSSEQKRAQVLHVWRSENLRGFGRPSQEIEKCINQRCLVTPEK